MDEKIKEKINLEISKLDLLIGKSSILIEKCRIIEPDFFELNAIGSILHSYYNGLENIFTLVGKHIDNAYFSSQKWHKELLNSMFAETERRKPVLDENIHEQLLDYMSFRHVFRHSYGYELDWERLRPLFFGIIENWTKVKDCIQKFTNGKSCDNLK